MGAEFVKVTCPVVEVVMVRPVPWAKLPTIQLVPEARSICPVVVAGVTARLLPETLRGKVRPMVPDKPPTVVVALKRLRPVMAPVRPFREVVVLKLGARFVKVKVFEEEVIWMPVEVASPMVPV